MKVLKHLKTHGKNIFDLGAPGTSTVYTLEVRLISSGLTNVRPRELEVLGVVQQVGHKIRTRRRHLFFLERTCRKRPCLGGFSLILLS